MKHDAVTVHGMAVGGDGVARLDDGRIVFVRGSVTGDVVSVEITETKSRFSRARVRSIIEPSPWRTEAPCPAVARGCGGCDWQHVSERHRARIFVDLVDDVLRRQGGVEGATSTYGGGADSWSYRTTLRLAIDDSQSAFRAVNSHDLVPVDACIVAAPPLTDLIRVKWPGAREVTLRCGSRTRERMAVVTPTRSADPELPGDVVVVGRDELAAGTTAWIHEEAAERRWRISADSFFQPSPQAAELLVTTVQGLAGDHLTDAVSVVDLFGGIGLFTGALASEAPDATWTLVESSASAIADATVNLGDLDVNIVRVGVERWSSRDCDLVIADPPRTGLARAGVEAVVSGHPEAAVLVSCDLGSLGRDVKLLTERGYRWVSSVVLDIFGQTSHVEVVTLLEATNR